MAVSRLTDRLYSDSELVKKRGKVKPRSEKLFQLFPLLKEAESFPSCHTLDWAVMNLQHACMTIADLKDRVVPHKEYEIVWHKRCEKMHKDLEAERKRRSHEAKPKETKCD